MRTVLTVATVLGLLAPSIAHADGKQLFLDAKCNKCHTVEAQEIAVLPRTDGKEADADKKPVDLSKVGGEHDAAFVKSWLLREIDQEGKKHKAPKYKGTEEDLTTLSTWVAGLK